MRKKLFLLVVIFAVFDCALFFSASRRGAQELIPSGHWVYDSLMALSLESKMINFADAAPLTIQEIKLYLSEIDYDSLSDSGRADYDSIISYLNEKNFSFGYNILSLGIDHSVNV